MRESSLKHYLLLSVVFANVMGICIERQGLAMFSGKEMADIRQ